MNRYMIIYKKMNKTTQKQIIEIAKRYQIAQGARRLYLVKELKISLPYGRN